MTVAKAVKQMVTFYAGNIRDIEHFVKVWGYAKTIGELEQLDPYTQETLELAAVVHDIACPLCREKYGNADGVYQQIEGAPLAKAFFAEYALPQEQVERICFLVAHHHTYNQVEGLDYQILLEADFLVNASEGKMDQATIRKVEHNVFRTEAGKALLEEIYSLNREG